MPRRKTDLPNRTRPRRATRTPRLSKGSTGDHAFNDTIRVLTDKGAVEYTEASYQISELGGMLLIWGRREDGQSFIAALYNANSWGAVLTIPRAPAQAEEAPAQETPQERERRRRENASQPPETPAP